MNGRRQKIGKRSLRRPGVIALALVAALSAQIVDVHDAQAGDDAPKANAKAPTKATAKDGEKGGKPAAGANTSELQSKLQSGQEDSILEALTVIAEQRNPEHAPLVAGLLERGSTGKVLLLALDTAGRLKSPTLGDRVAPYIRHRNGEVRRAAVRALVKTQGPHAAAALRQALRSADPFVRNTAASGLGSLGAKDAVEDLFKALANNVAEAAASIGQLCDAANCEKLADLLGKAPFDIVTGGLEQALFRPASEVPDATKIKIVVRLREVGTNESRRYLGDVRSRWPADASAAVRQALDSAVKGAPGGQK
ncbi:MAG TPA: HEAT repeat domain-containing protein [Polyangiaceae bacterium]|nr:HEAT repeat domain-containing protein [Polyangiaceae bacterium]